MAYLTNKPKRTTVALSKEELTIAQTIAESIANRYQASILSFGEHTIKRIKYDIVKEITESYPDTASNISNLSMAIATDLTLAQEFPEVEAE
jgi:hypothetical protein